MSPRTFPDTPRSTLSEKNVQPDEDADALHPHVPDQAQPTLDDLFWRAAQLRGDVPSDVPFDAQAKPPWPLPSEAEIAVDAADRMSEAMWLPHVTRIELAGEIWNVEKHEHHLLDAYCSETDVRPYGAPRVRVNSHQVLRTIWFFPRAQRFVLEIDARPLTAWMN
jgi:hypothetical protein